MTDPQEMTDTELYWRHKEAKDLDDDMPGFSKSDRVEELEAEMVLRWCERMEMNHNV